MGRSIADRSYFKLAIRAGGVVLSAGAINSPAVLLRSKAPDPHGTLGRRTFLHPVAFTAATLSSSDPSASGLPSSAVPTHRRSCGGVERSSVGNLAGRCSDVEGADTEGKVRSLAAKAAPELKAKASAFMDAHPQSIESYLGYTLHTTAPTAEQAEQGRAEQQ